MEKTLSINLGGVAFHITETAFEALSNYLDALKKKFGNETERQEIMNDIEARIAELLTQKMGAKKELVGIEDIEDIIRQMGQPEDIAGEEQKEDDRKTESTAAGESSSTSRRSTVKRRLFRDPDDAKIGGVISGLCHYFGIADPVWVRIAAVLLVFVTSGSFIFLYLLLLVVIPKATTAAEKLQMKGEPVNVNTIQKEVKGAATRFGASVKESMEPEGFFARLWDVLLFVGGAVARLMALVVLFVSSLALFALFLGLFFFFILGTTPFNGLTHLVVSSSSLISIAGVGVALFVGIPLLALIYLAMKTLSGHQSRMGNSKWVLFFGWLLGLFLMLYPAISTGLNFKSEAKKQELIPLMQPAGGSLWVQLADSTAAGWVPENEDSTEEDEEAGSYGTVMINGTNIAQLKSFKIGKPEVALIASSNDSFYLQKIVSSRGKNTADAARNADLVRYAFSQTDSVLNLSRYFELEKRGGKYRAQEMLIRIAVPEGKRVMLSKNVDLQNDTEEDSRYDDDTALAPSVWTATSGRMHQLPAAP